MTSTTAYTAPNTTAKMISYPPLIAGATRGFVVLIGLLSFLKKSGSQKKSSKISSKDGSIKKNQYMQSQNIRFVMSQF